MKILVKPSDLISMFIWDKYKHFCLEDKTPTEISELIKKNEEFEIDEKDAFVIGLTNVIYTNEIVYKFKQFLKETLENKSFDIDNKHFINKELLIDAIGEFGRKLPKEWKSEDPAFNKGLKELPKAIQQFDTNLNKLPTVSVQDWPCVNYISVKKIINKL